MAILTGVRWCLSIGFDLHCLMTRDIERLFMCLVAVSTSLEKYLFRSSARLLFWLCVIIEFYELFVCFGS